MRINALDTPYFLDDVLAMVEANADGLVVPKTNTVEGILFVDRLVSLAEKRAGRAAGSVTLLPLIEQPEAIENVFAIARATPRIEAIAFGHGDFSLAMGIKEAPSTAGIVLHARCQVAMAAKAAGITPIDNVFLQISDIDGVVAEQLQLPGKPSPAMFLEAAKRLDASPERAAVVEDALAGVQAGRRGGFGLVVGVDRVGQAEALRTSGAHRPSFSRRERSQGPAAQGALLQGM